MTRSSSNREQLHSPRFCYFVEEPKSLDPLRICRFGKFITSLIGPRILLMGWPSQHRKIELFAATPWMDTVERSVARLASISEILPTHPQGSSCKVNLESRGFKGCRCFVFVCLCKKLCVHTSPHREVRLLRILTLIQVATCGCCW